MWKRRAAREQVPQLTFPEPREGLPEGPRPFIGAAQLRVAATLMERLSRHCLVAVVGPVGIGKSAVAARAANSRWARQWFLQDEGGHPVHRRFWADLADCRPGAETEERIARAVGRANFAQAMARLGNGKPGLLVIDNADRALGPVGDGDPVLHQLARWVERGASVVVTVRQVASLAVDRPWSDTIEVPDMASDEDAKQLFDRLAPEHANHWRVRELVARCAGVPLAVSLLGRLAAGYSLDRISDVTPVGDRREASRGLPFAVDLAASLLDPDERRLWAGLSLFPAGLSGGDKLTGAGDEISAVFESIPDRRNRTVRLHDLGLAQRCDAGVRIPGSLRPDSGAAGLDPSAISGFWQRYLSLGHQAVAAGNVDRWLIRHQANLDQLAATSPVPDGALELSCRALLAHRGGPVHDSLDATLVAVAEAASGGAGAPALAATAVSLLEQDRSGAAILIAGVNLGGQAAGEDQAAAADALCLLGRSEGRASRYHDAGRHLSEALTGYESLGDVLGQATSHLEMGRVELAMGRLDEAEKHLLRALAGFGEVGVANGEANTRLELVRVDLARGHHDAAQLQLADSLRSFEKAGDPLGQANARLQLGQVDLAAGRLEEAGQHLVTALTSYHAVGDRLGQANASLQLGQVDMVRGRLAQAEQRLRDALAGYEEVGDRVGQAHAGLQLGQIDLALGRGDAAEGRFSHALAGYRLIGDRLGQANASMQLAKLDLALGRFEEAGQRLADAQDGYDEIGDRLGQANCRHLIAAGTEMSGDPGGAVADFVEAAAIYASIGRRDSAGWNLAAAARASAGDERTGYATRALTHLQQAGRVEEVAKLAAEFELEVPSTVEATDGLQVEGVGEGVDQRH